MGRHLFSTPQTPTLRFPELLTL